MMDYLLRSPHDYCVKLQREREEKKLRQEEAAQQGGAVAEQVLPTENPNRIAAELTAQGIVQADTVEAALSALSVGELSS